MQIIVGLGNPGTKYENTRHNIGFIVIDELARQRNLVWKENKKFKAMLAEDSATILVKPQTFMNKSGETVAAIMRYYKLIPRSILGIKKAADLSSCLTVIHDELDLPFGKNKLSIDSSSAGHNGVQSIIDYLKTKNFKRLRIGIDSEQRKKMPTENYVLQKFNDEEKNTIKELLPDLTRNL
ncbi:MAG: aminoacyl-tRNA hydrolase [Candidatus Falkowbacteria bacterium]|nr:aminoacyl-tRNA hydrolase [Candidatus Falkowbacteria bacterium]